MGLFLMITLERKKLTQIEILSLYKEKFPRLFEKYKRFLAGQPQEIHTEFVPLKSTRIDLRNKG
jgi:hypothetical protein